jgi:subtilisin family serine protease
VTASSFQSGYSASWFAQINLTAAVESQANEGAGITLALVDTGVSPTSPELTGRISPASACAAVTFVCSNGYDDDEGHGTATASIAGGAYNPSTDLMSGVAPAVTILSEKALDAQGSGYDIDVANGIMQAANNGANVISLSLTYIPTQAVVNAINYAVDKGIYIVWAAGNASSAINGGADTTGLDPAALTHLTIVGSVNSSNVLSTFSNTPGTGNIVSSNGSLLYSQVWLMAPGENILAPAIQYGGDSVYGYWTGTSMSTPEVAGAIALLEAAWPILKTNGEAAQVLYASATSLGAAATYGNGLLNLAAAFSPIGPITLYTASGAATVTVTMSGGNVVASGALGSMPGVSSVLSHYTGFDSFQRNFTFNLSGMIAGPRRGPTPTPSFAPPLVTNSTADGGGQMMAMGISQASFAQGVFGGAWRPGESLSEDPLPDPAFFSYASAGGAFVAVGHGVSPGLSFAQAAWGADSLAARQSDSLGVVNSLANLAQGGDFGALGGQMLGRFRVAASWTSTPTAVGSAMAADRTRSDAQAASIALTAKVTPRWTMGMTYSALHEDNALLGSTYAGGGLLDLGDHRASRMLGLSSAFDLGGQRSLLGEVSLAQTDGANGLGGLIGSVSALRSTAWGISFVQGDTVSRGDSLSFSLRQPLRVTSGEAEMAVTGVDSFGFPVTTITPVSLVPNGHETDAVMNYTAPISQWASFRGEVSYRTDADNTAGLDDVALRLGMHLAF